MEMSCASSRVGRYGERRADDVGGRGVVLLLAAAAALPFVSTAVYTCLRRSAMVGDADLRECYTRMPRVKMGMLLAEACAVESGVTSWQSVVCT